MQMQPLFALLLMLICACSLVAQAASHKCQLTEAEQEYAVGVDLGAARLTAFATAHPLDEPELVSREWR